MAEILEGNPKNGERLRQRTSAVVVDAALRDLDQGGSEGVASHEPTGPALGSVALTGVVVDLPTTTAETVTDEQVEAMLEWAHDQVNGLGFKQSVPDREAVLEYLFRHAGQWVDAAALGNGLTARSKPNSAAFMSDLVRTTAGRTGSVFEGYRFEVSRRGSATNKKGRALRFSQYAPQFDPNSPLFDPSFEPPQEPGHYDGRDVDTKRFGADGDDEMLGPVDMVLAGVLGARVGQELTLSEIWSATLKESDVFDDLRQLEAALTRLAELGYLYRSPRQDALAYRYGLPQPEPPPKEGKVKPKPRDKKTKSALTFDERRQSLALAREAILRQRETDKDDTADLVAYIRSNVGLPPDFSPSRTSIRRALHAAGDVTRERALERLREWEARHQEIVDSQTTG